MGAQRAAKWETRGTRMAALMILKMKNREEEEEEEEEVQSESAPKLMTPQKTRKRNETNGSHFRFGHK